MRTPSAVLTGLLFGLLIASPAWGHGDQYRDPKPGDQPPWLRRPEDPTPPPPPPEMTTQRRLGADDWFFWWQANAARFENLKWNLYHRMGSSPLFVTDRDEPYLERSGESRLTLRRMREIGLPALFAVLDAEEAGDDHVRAAAWLALGKTVPTDEQAARLLELATAASDAPPATCESRNLAFGLLQRARPEDQLDGALLDRVRTFLLREVASARPPRVRAAAALALGLLGSQAREVSSASDEIDSLLAVLETTGRNEEPGTSILVAVGLYPPEAVPPAARTRIRHVVLRGRVPSGPAHTAVRAEAVRALGRIGDVAETGTLRRVLLLSDVSPYDRQSAVIALTLLGERFPTNTSQGIPALLLHAAIEEGEAGTRGLALIGLATWSAARRRCDVGLGAWDDVVSRFLGGRLERGESAERGFAALALGILAREVGDDLPETEQRIRDRALAPLRFVLDGDADANDDAEAVRPRAAAALALGLAWDSRSRERLLEVLEDPAEEVDVRASAAWGLGLLGECTANVVRTLGAYVRGDDPALRRRSIRALGLLGQPWVPGWKGDALPVLLEDLADGKDAARRLDTLVALARVADHRAVEKVARLLEDPEQSSHVRALAAAALGAIGDLEYRSVLDRLREHASYRARSSFLRDVYAYL